MEIVASDVQGRDAYRLLISCLVPRPIAWVSTMDLGTRVNLAPFSFFGGVTTSPPIVMVSVGRRRGERKDTARNLLVSREAVVHVCDRPLAKKMVATSADVDHGVDEFELAGLTKAASVDVRPPRVAEAPIAMEARLERHMEIGEGPNDVFLLEIVRYHLRDDVLVDGLPDPARLAAVGRLGGAHYCDTAAPFDVPRPA
jgi:flavin reductase (DIM6/NTAB) family NADH-FMN oxidoreductase RutF